LEYDALQSLITTLYFAGMEKGEGILPTEISFLSAKAGQQDLGQGQIQVCGA